MAEGQEQHHHPDMVPLEEYNALRQEFEEFRIRFQDRGNPNDNPPPPPAPQPFIFQEPHPFNAGARVGRGNQPQPRAYFQGAPPEQQPVLPILPPIPEENYPPEAPAKEADTAMARKLQNIEDALKTMQGPHAYVSTDYTDLCFVPDLKLPYKFKVPDFSKYDGTGDPRAHLKLYAGALCGHPDSEKLMLRFFQQSLTGPAAGWLANLDVRPIKTWNDLAQEFIKQYRYNTELSLDRVYLMRMKQEPGESFRTYA